MVVDYSVCDHFWDYKFGTKKGVDAVCTKCKVAKKFTWYEWKSMLRSSKNLGTSRF